MNTHLITSAGLPLVKGETPLSYYLDHPPLLSWLISITQLLAPDSVSASRWVSITASLTLFLLLLFLSERLLGRKAALFCALGILSFRIFWYHGIVLNFEPLSAALILVSVFFWGEYFYSGKDRRIFPALIFWVLGMLADWPAFLIAPVIGYAFMKKHSVSRALALMLLPVTTGLMILLYYGIQSGNFWFISHFFNVALFWRLLPNQLQIADITPWGIAVWQMCRNFVANFGWQNFPVFLILFFLVLRNWKMIPQQLKFIGITLFCAATLNMLLFKDWAATHGFWSYYYLPLNALCLAWLMKLITWSSPHQKSRAALWLFFAISVFITLRPIPALVASVNSEETQAKISGFFKYRDPGINIYVHSVATLFGSGYIARWYLDRQPEPIQDMNTLFKKEDYLMIRSFEWDALEQHHPALKACPHEHLDGVDMIPLSNPVCKDGLSKSLFQS